MFGVKVLIGEKMYVTVLGKVINSSIFSLWIIVHGSTALGIGGGQLSS